MRVPFNRPFATGKEFDYIREAIEAGQLAGDGRFTKRCHEWLCEQLRVRKALLTHSCTAALEMSALLAEVGPGDEVIVPSYTFVSTANAFALRGATPVFVDVREDTLNLDERLVEAAVTEKTKAICVVHYAGVACEMDEILRIADRARLIVVEDDAQGLMSSYRGKPLGSLGHLAALSFHETKNVIAGEGGALLVNDPRFQTRSEILWQKGTNRQAFFRGEVDKYSWVDLGSSFLASELTAAFLWAQMEDAASITRRRLSLWQRYHAAFEPLEKRGRARRPIVPAHCAHNAHMYYLLCQDIAARTRVIQALKEKGIHAVFHYVPLHSSPAGTKLGRVHGSMAVTDSVASRLVRLPLFGALTEAEADEVAGIVLEALG